jgi:chorismate synthase
MPLKDLNTEADLWSKMKGSEHNDLYNSDGTTKTNLSGGIQGGISNGMDIYFRWLLNQ